ncbi:MAG: SurA N-terminal domain-containing protein [Candidatus Omnitrophica bacterium]|nr:SurA N-terminal domain-containing protein [Candidatus Omnitrophota bacterium]
MNITGDENMLKILRDKKTAKKVWIGLAIIIIPAFTLWGFGGGTDDKNENTPIGKISGHSISGLEFKESLAAVRTSAILQFGDKLPEVEKYLNLEAQAWERLILLYEAKRRKIAVSDKEVVDLIQNAPYFRDKSGFNNKIYQETLRYVFRLQTRTFEEQMRQSLILDKLYKQVTEKINLSEEQIRQEYLKLNEELKIDYIAGFYLEFAKKIKPKDKELAVFFEKNKAMFKIPPTKDKEAYIPEFAQVKDKVKETFIKETSQETVRNKIRECAEKIKKTSFSKAAKACGLKSGSTDFFKSNDQIKELGNAEVFWLTAKKLDKNQLSDTIFNDKGYYIIRLEGIKPLDENKFLKEKPEFSQRLLSAKRNETFNDFAAELNKTAQHK